MCAGESGCVQVKWKGSCQWGNGSECATRSVK